MRAAPILGLAAASVCSTPDESVAQTTEERLAALEARVAELEARLRDFEGGSGGVTIGETVVTGESPITARLLDKHFNEGRIQDYLMFELGFSSALHQPVIAFTGVVIFTDLFDQEILRLNITSDERLGAGETVSWVGGIGYDSGRGGHVRLRNVRPSELRLRFNLDAVTYENGIRETFRLR
jgi:hypothetical protein